VTLSDEFLESSSAQALAGPIADDVCEQMFYCNISLSVLQGGTIVKSQFSMLIEQNYLCG
jgi:hypothetical protein